MTASNRRKIPAKHLRWEISSRYHWRSYFWSDAARQRPATIALSEIFYYRFSIACWPNGSDTKTFMLGCNDFHPDILYCFKGSGHSKVFWKVVILIPDNIHGKYLQRSLFFTKLADYINSLTDAGTKLN